MDISADSIEISPKDAKLALDSNDPPYLLDVREQTEVSLCKIKGSVNIPMNEVPAQIETLPKERVILCYCHHGGRSRAITEYLISTGFDAKNLHGGIHAWSTTVDPSIPQY